MPDWHAIVRDRIAARHLDPAAGEALVEELAQHLEDRFAESRAAGADEAEALARALDELDGHERLADELARRRTGRIDDAPPVDAPRSTWRTGLWTDVVRAGRGLVRTPAFALAATATVALTTGPTTAALGMANWLFLAPVPGVAAPDRLAAVNFGTPTDTGGYSVSRVSYPHLEAMVAAAPSVQAMAGWQPGSVSISTGATTPVVARTEFVSASYFQVLGVRLAAGRGFLPEEDRAWGGAPVAVIAAPLAASLFPGRDAAGQAVRINGQHFTVVGVAAPEFFGSQRLGRTEVWVPGLASPRVSHAPPDRWAYAADRGPFYMHIARIAPGASFDQASAELRAAAAALAANDPSARKFATVQPLLEPGFATVPGRLRSAVTPLAGVGLVLVLLGTANLANLFGFRSARHAQESAVRRALGASAYRLARPLVLEALLVAVLGGLLGLTLAVGLRTTMGAMLVGSQAVEVPVSWRLGAGALGLSVVVGVLLALLPARLAARASLTAVIGQGSRGATRAGTRVRRGLAAVQLALSMTLLIGALLFVNSLRNLRGVDAGFDPANLQTFQFEFRLQGYTSGRVETFFRDLMAAVSAQPGVTAVAVGTGTPQFGGETHYRVWLPDSPVEAPARIPVNEVTPGYFEALGIRLVAGGGFHDGAGSEPAGVVISESLARRAFGSARGAIGGLLRFPRTQAEPERAVPVIGVAADVRAEDLRETPEAAIYRPLTRWLTFNHVLMVRSTRPPDALDRDVRHAAASIDPALVVTSLAMDERIDAQLGQERLLAWALGILAGLGFVIAGVGLHGLISQAVVERTREFGIRIAVGASRAQVVALVLRSALAVVVMGVPLGMGLAWLGAGIVRSRLFGVTPADPAVDAAAIAALAGVVIAASLWPAWRAARANPVDVLRAD